MRIGELTGEMPPPALEDGRGRVLVVDDDEQASAMLREVLVGEGHEVLVAGDGPTGLRYAAEWQPDAVVLDVMMPGLDGFSVCARLKADPATAPIPVLLLTSLGAREDRLRGIRSGANDFITRPADIEELAFRVRNAVIQHLLYLRLQRDFQALRDGRSLRDNLVQLVVRDMGTPLDALDAALEAARGAPAAPGDARALQAAAAAAAGLREMTRALLDVGRLELDALPVRRMNCDLASLAAAAAAAFEPLVGARRLVVRRPEEAVHVLADPDLLRRVVVALLWNAMQYASAAGAIELTVSNDALAARLEVWDDGPDIPESVQDAVFDRVRQACLRTSGSSRAAGVHLAFAGAAVAALGGTVGLRSGPGEGCAFWLSLSTASAPGEGAA